LTIEKHKGTEKDEDHLRSSEIIWEIEPLWTNDRFQHFDLFDFDASGPELSEQLGNQMS
jgi:hypothetical protein